MCITRLHNYVINEGEIPDDVNSVGENGERLFLPSEPEMMTVDEDSDIRNILVNRISDMGITRPLYNSERNI